MSSPDGLQNDPEFTALKHIAFNRPRLDDGVHAARQDRKRGSYESNEVRRALMPFVVSRLPALANNSGEPCERSPEAKT